MPNELSTHEYECCVREYRLGQTERRLRKMFKNIDTSVAFGFFLLSMLMVAVFLPGAW